MVRYVGVGNSFFNVLHVRVPIGQSRSGWPNLQDTPSGYEMSFLDRVHRAGWWSKSPKDVPSVSKEPRDLANTSNVSPGESRIEEMLEIKNCTKSDAARYPWSSM